MILLKSLIERNKTKFIEDHLEFYCLDISKEKLPHADCIILRQVLQHLSNENIKYIVRKFKDYKYVILTEHVPIGNFTPNVDIISGQGIRLKQKSGVNVLKPPFNLKIKEQEIISRIVLNENKDQILTTIFTL